MGAWDAGVFDNDDAADWLYELYESEGTPFITETLSAVTAAGAADYIEAPECCNALAAAEIVAACMGKSCADLPDEARDWLNENAIKVGPDVVVLAGLAVDRIEAASELKDLWDESDAAEAWYTALRDLRARLHAPPAR